MQHNEFYRFSSQVLVLINVFSISKFKTYCSIIDILAQLKTHTMMQQKFMMYVTSKSIQLLKKLNPRVGTYRFTCIQNVILKSATDKMHSATLKLIEPQKLCRNI